MMRDPKKMEAIAINDMEQDDMKHRNEEGIDNTEVAELAIAVGRGPIPAVARCMNKAIQEAMLFEPSFPAELRPSGHESPAAARAVCGPRKKINPRNFLRCGPHAGRLIRVRRRVCCDYAVCSCRSLLHV